MAGDGLAQFLAAAAQQGRGAIAHHGGQLFGGLPRVEGHGDQPLSHDGQIHRRPLDAVVGQQGAAVAATQAIVMQEQADPPDGVEKGAAGDVSQPVAANLLKHDAVDFRRVCDLIVVWYHYTEQVNQTVHLPEPSVPEFAARA